MKKILITTIICVLTIVASCSQTTERIFKKFTDEDFKTGDVILCPDILFTLSGGCQIMPQSKDSVKIISDFIQKHPSFKIEISSHTDNRGSKEANLLLSEHRAKTIVEYLTKELLLPDDNILAKGYGSSQLLISDDIIKKAIIDNESKDAVEKLHQKNRRIEIKILKTL
ncbi:MAG: OmpA family protein [Bacteroidia bacterium]|nr:OmpA family protein [Bacteroidia bacterium]